MSMVSLLGLESDMSNGSLPMMHCCVRGNGFMSRCIININEFCLSTDTFLKGPT